MDGRKSSSPDPAMPRTPFEVDQILNQQQVLIGQLQTENARQQEQIRNLQAIVGVGTAPAPAVSLAAIAKLLEPIAGHAANILAVQSGALGVRP